MNDKLRDAAQAAVDLLKDDDRDGDIIDASVELRRLHEVNAELLEQVKDLMAELKLADEDH